MSLTPILLIGEQKKVLFLPHKNPIQIKGVAGSGKTTVAMYRAKHLIETFADLFDEPHAIIFTYNKSLTKYIAELLPQVIGGYREGSETPSKLSMGLNVRVSNFHKWTYDFIQSKGLLAGKSVCSQTQLLSSISAAIRSSRARFSDARILNKDTVFFEEEFSWIKGKLFDGEQDYLDTPRVGRGTSDRVQLEDKKVIWDCYQAYRKVMSDNHLVDFDDFALLTLQEIDRDKIFLPPFTHIVVDEAQDLNKAQMVVLRKLVRSETDSITIIADAAQRIYKSGFSWAEIGISVAGGRTIELKRNYRNTYEIALAANSLLEKETDRRDFTSIDLSAITRRGPKPNLAYFKNYASGMAYFVSQLRSLNFESESVVVLHRNRRNLNVISASLTASGIPNEIIQRDFTCFSKQTAKVCTLSSVKGLEFDHVIIMDLNDDIIPFPAGMSDDEDEYHISTERRLLYTAMTRARKSLTLVSSGKPSRYLDEIDSNTITVVQDTQKTAEVTSSTVLSNDDLPF